MILRAHTKSSNTKSSNSKNNHVQRVTAHKSQINETTINLACGTVLIIYQLLRKGKRWIPKCVKRTLKSRHIDSGIGARLYNGLGMISNA